MSFFKMSDGTQAEATTSFDSGGGEITPIPNDTQCIAAIEEAKWDEYNGDRFITIKWRVQQPGEYANRVLFHKVKVFGLAKDKDPAAVADKAKRMLLAIDANAGGKLAKLNAEPSDSDLAVSLVGKMMAIKVMVWEMEIDGKEKSGNWVAAVSAAKGAAAKPAPAAKKKPEPEAEVDEDDIPFN